MLARSRTVKLLGDMADMERLINRVRGGIAAPRELVALRTSLENIPHLAAALAGCPVSLTDSLKPCPEVVEVIEHGIVDQPPATLDEGEVIAQLIDAGVVPAVNTPYHVGIGKHLQAAQSLVQVPRT